jgi:hypothetical protein
MRILIEVLRVYGWFSAIDWAVVSIAIAIGILLTVAAIALLIFARTRKPIYPFLLATLLPVLIAILGSFLQFYIAWNILRRPHAISTSEVMLGVSEHCLALISPGLLASTPSLLLSLLGLFVKGRKIKTIENTQRSQQLTATPVFVS